MSHGSGLSVGETSPLHAKQPNERFGSPTVDYGRAPIRNLIFLEPSLALSINGYENSFMAKPTPHRRLCIGFSGSMVSAFPLPDRD